jgi:Cellulose biosynthesis GIL
MQQPIVGDLLLRFLNKMTNTTATAPDNAVKPNSPSTIANPKLANLMGASVGDRSNNTKNGVGIHLGVVGIDPRQSEMIVGGLYALKVTTPSTRFALLATSLKAAMSSGVHCTLITNSAPDEVLSRLAQCTSFPANDLVKQKRLSVFSMQDEFSKKLFRFGADRFVQEIENFEIPANSFIVFEQADDVLSLHDLWLASQQIKVLSQWFKRRQTTGLMAFTRSNAQQTAALNALMDNLSGLARLGADKAGLELTFLYWQSQSGVMAARNFHLQSTQDGGYEAQDQPVTRMHAVPTVSVHEATQNASSANFDAIIANTGNPSVGALGVPNMSGNVSSEMAKQIAAQVTAQLASARNSLADSTQLSDELIARNTIAEPKKAARDSTYFFIHNDPEFEKLASLIPGKFCFAQSVADILHVALERPKAMILLTVHANQELSSVANAIHTIRKNVGSSAKIVVHERRGSLTEGQRNFLKLCGINEIILDHEAASNIPARLLELHDKPSNVMIEPNFNTILTSMAAQLGKTESLTVGLETVGLEKDPINFLAGGQTDQLADAPNVQRVIEKAKRSAMRTAR